MKPSEDELATLRGRAVAAYTALVERDCDDARHQQDIRSLEEKVYHLELEADSYLAAKDAFIQKNKPYPPEYLSRFEIMEWRCSDTGIPLDDLWHLDPYEFAMKYSDHWAARAWFECEHDPSRIDLFAANLQAMRRLSSNFHVTRTSRKGEK